MIPFIAAALAHLAACQATDGDTIRCGNERIRILGIDAPELPGHCRKGRICAPGDPYAAKDQMALNIAGRKITVRRHGKDRYGRTLAHVYADGQNVACIQLSSGHAIYKPQWDNRPKGQVKRECHL